jgi:predicted anti-sigma-YlaC factor YlaD
MYYYPVKRVAFIVGLLGIIVSAALLVGAIMALHFVKPMGIKLGLVGVFTTLFAASLTLLTHARRIEVYGATAA